MAKSWPAKDPQEVLDYGLDWSPRMTEGDTIIMHSATVTVGAVEVDDSYINNNGTSTTTWLSGGVADEPCEINLQAKTAEGRVFEETLKIKIKNR